jgi:hypothetical protein
VARAAKAAAVTAIVDLGVSVRVAANARVALRQAQDRLTKARRLRSLRRS